MYKYTSIDGLAHSNNIEFIKCWNNIVKKSQKKYCEEVRKKYETDSKTKA